MKVYLVRHGESEDSAKGLHQRPDSPLTKEGNVETWNDQAHLWWIVWAILFLVFLFLFGGWVGFTLILFSN